MLSQSKVVSILKEAGLEPKDLVICYHGNEHVVGFFLSDSYTHCSYYLYSFKEGRGLKLKEITKEEYMDLIAPLSSFRSDRKLTNVEKLLMSQEKVTVEDLLNADKAQK